jgi:hypothetical protein
VFEVLPFNNKGLVVAPISAANLVKLLKENVKTCGFFGTLVFSGLKVTYRRDCERNESVKQKQLDPQAILVKVEQVNKARTILYDADANIQPPAKQFLVATLDFIAKGSDRFGALSGPGISVVQDLDILREGLVQQLLQKPGRWSGELDNRYELLGK